MKTFVEMRVLLEVDKQRKYSSLQIDLPEPLSSLVLAKQQSIPDSILVDDGKETNIHTTVKYGLLAEQCPKQLVKLLQIFGPFEITLGKISVFENEKCDVVKIDVHSPKLYELNRIVTETFQNTSTHPVYIPHVTIAYVLPGKGKTYVGDTSFVGLKFVVNRYVFSSQNSTKTVISIS